MNKWHKTVGHKHSMKRSFSFFFLLSEKILLKFRNCFKKKFYNSLGTIFFFKKNFNDKKCNIFNNLRMKRKDFKA